MSATADKARYFLEQSVPELKEFERKKIFSSNEITSIARKRSDFEHKINARGSKPSDYAQYAEFEINVDTLRRKRVKRLGVKSTAHNGQRRIYFVFDRGTRKFPGDIGLWMQSIEYARRQKAYKKLMQMFTNVLRLHPAKSELWIYAAQFAIEENSDMTEARSYMQRGLRFCKNSRNIWLEYVRLELGYMAKIHSRRQVLGIGPRSDTEVDVQEPPEGEEDGLLKLPKLTADDIMPDTDKDHDIDTDALQALDSTPVMSGAIPQAIFDAAMDHFHYDGPLSKELFDIFADFDQIPTIVKILDHVVESLCTSAADQWQTQACYVSRPTIGISSSQPEFPVALRQMFSRIYEALGRTSQRLELLNWYQSWVQLWLEQDLDPAIRRVISAHLRVLDTDSV